MSRRSRLMLVLALFTAGYAKAAEVSGTLPRALDSYHDPINASLWEVLRNRLAVEPLNAVASLIFFLAIVHSFFATQIRHWAHRVEERHTAGQTLKRAAAKENENGEGYIEEVSFFGQLLHFFSEVEVVFGLWAVVLMGAITWFESWPEVVSYVGTRVSYTEPLFVVVVMALASTRPILDLAERGLSAVARIGRGTPGAWWLSILIIAPLLGSLITEPAAMTIGALLLARQFYKFKPSSRLAYATLGLLFVNVSVGGTLTHFAAPPVIMVAHRWDWDLIHMLTYFGWRAAVGIVISTILYYFIFRRELVRLRSQPVEGKREFARPAVPGWIIAVHLCFLAFTVWQAHTPVLFIGAFLFFLAFSEATAHHQNPVDLRAPVLVGFFLAGLVIHGGLQAWWIQPVLSRLGALPLFIGATLLTAVNDNAAITYLATLVPDFTDPLKYAVVAGAVTGGGLTVIANAPNPAGQAILASYFPDGVAPLKLAMAALLPTAVMAACFLVP